MVGAKEIYHEKIVLEELKHGIFSERSRNITQTLVIALGAGLGIWGAINLMEASYNYCKCWMTLKLRKPETLRYCSQSIFREVKIA